MEPDALTQYILAARCAADPNATLEHIVQFANLDKKFRSECEAGTIDRRTLFTHLGTITDDETAPARLGAVISIATDKLRLKPAGGPASSNSSGGAQRKGGIRRRAR